MACTTYIYDEKRCSTDFFYSLHMACSAFIYDEKSCSTDFPQNDRARPHTHRHTHARRLMDPASTLELCPSLPFGLVWPPYITFREQYINYRLEWIRFFCLCVRCAGNVFSSLVTKPVAKQLSTILVDIVTLGNVFS
jgi:hypothetical protein